MSLTDSIEKKIPENWDFVELKDIAKIYDGTHQTPKYCETGIPFYSVEHVVADNFSKTKFISEEVFEKENRRVKLEKGDVLMTRIGNVGTAKYIDWDVMASFYVSLALFKCKENINAKYLSQYINSYYFQKELWKKIIHVAFPIKINLGDLKKCKIPLPSLPEQQKIADILSTIDYKISVIDQQIIATEKLKRGLMQRLLTKGIGHTEFKDSTVGKIPKSWRVQNLSELAKVKGRIGYRGYTKKDLVEKGNGALTLGGAQITKHNKLNLSQPTYLNWEKYEESPEIKVDNGDIILAQRGTLGRLALIDNLPEPATINPSMVLIKNIHCNPNYLYYCLCSDYTQNYISRITTSTAVPMISQKQINDFKIGLPFIEEQKEIVEILTTVDNKLQTQKNKKQAYQQFKKGLMQQLLTGKIRVINLVEA